MKHCKHGHALNSKTLLLRPYVWKGEIKFTKVCKACRAVWQKRKYHTDAKFRHTQIEKSKERYRRKKAEALNCHAV